MSRRKRKQPTIGDRTHWTQWCPVCGEKGKVIGGCWILDHSRPIRLARWACEACAARLRSFAVLPDGQCNAAKGVKL